MSVLFALTVIADLLSSMCDSQCERHWLQDPSRRKGSTTAACQQVQSLHWMIEDVARKRASYT